MSKSPTRIVGPWYKSSHRDGVLDKMRAFGRPFAYAGMYWIEVWPDGKGPGDKVHRADLPLVGVLPKLTFRPSPNVSARNDSIRGIVIHETEGSYVGAVSWLRNPISNVSAHLVVNEAGTEASQLVRYGDKAWHALNANGHTIGIEMAGFTSKVNKERQVMAVARICAVLCHHFTIRPVEADRHGLGGITTHRALGAFGGGHRDPGGFSWPEFMRSVRSEFQRVGNRPVVYGRD